MNRVKRYGVNVAATPRLPTLDQSLVYQPPLVPGGGAIARPPIPPATLVSKTDSAEAYEVTFQTTQFAAGTSDGSEQSVWSTSQRWKALDVYVDTSNLAVAAAGGNGLPYLCVCVYAVVGGMRILAASGRTRALGGAQAFAGVHIAAVRISMAERFEITAQVLSGTISSPTGSPPSANFSIIASDDAGLYADDSSVGVIPFSPQSSVGNQGLTTATSLQIAGAFFGTAFGAGSGNGALFVGVQATNIIGSPRWLQLFKLGGTAPVNGSIPTLAWSLPAAGSMVFGTESKLFGAIGRANWMLCVSTTGPTLTYGTAGDVAYNGYCR